MKVLFKFLFLFSFCLSFSQEDAQKPDSLRTDYLNASYRIHEDTTVIKTLDHSVCDYRNYALGKISSMDIINPFEIVLFYSDFNTVVLLDNHLNEIQVIPFTSTILFANKSISNKLWIYNSDSQQLQLFDYKSKIVTLSSQVLTDFEPIKMESDFNSVKLIGKKKTLFFNQYLSLKDITIRQKNN